MMEFVLSSCAGKQLAVNNADTLLEHQIKKRLPLYTAQKIELTKDVNKFLHEHKPLAREMLPMIDAINLEDPQKIDESYKKIVGFYEKIAGNFSELFAKHMATLDNKQQKEFFETLSDENRKIANVDEEEGLEKVNERFEKFFGSANEKQKGLLTKYASHFEERNKLRIERRRKLHQEFKDIYEGETSEGSKKKQFTQAFEHYYKNSMNHEKNIEMLKNLIPTLTAKQKEYFRSRTQEVKEILNYFLQADY